MMEYSKQIAIKRQAISAVSSSARLYFLHEKFIMDAKKEFENNAS